MILLDTNVVSELMRATPAPRVLTWFDDREPGELYLSAVSEAELRTGAALLPGGKRGDRLTAAIDAMIAEDFAGRVLPFDSPAARAYAAIATARRAAGHAIIHADGQIAAIASAAGAAVATRNIADFQDCGIEVVDPWTGGA